MATKRAILEDLKRTYGPSLTVTDVEETKIMKRACQDIAAIAISLFLLTGCGSQITHGKVIAKDFTPAHSRVVMVPVVHSTGESTFTTFHPFVYHYEDEWEITIQGFAADSSEMQTAVYSVSEEVYDAIELGDEFTWNEEMEQN